MANDDLLSGYIEESQFCELTGKSPRTVRGERQRGVSSAYVRWGRKIYYNVGAFKEFLRSLERHPVRRNAVARRGKAT
jgi:hypothetical protein